MYRFLEVEMCGQGRQVVGVVIHVMTAIGLRGTSMSPPVVSYDTIAVVEEEHHLRVQIIGRQRPAVAKHNGLTFAPVLVVNLRSVFGRNRGHKCSPCLPAPRGLMVSRVTPRRLREWRNSSRRTRAPWQS